MPRRRRPAPAASAPAAEVAAAGARLQLESASAPRAGAPARSASAASAGASAISELTAQVAANSLALDQERLRALEQRFNRLRSDNEATKRSLAELEAGLRAARDHRFDKWVVYGLAATVVLLLLALLLMLRRLLSQRNQSSWAEGEGDSQPAVRSSSPVRTPTPSLGSAAVVHGGDGDRPDPAVEHSDAPWSSVAPEVSESDGVQDAAAAAATDNEDDRDDADDDGHSLDQPQTMPGPNYGVLGTGAPATRHGVSIDELIDLEQQAEFFTVLGQDEAAIELLTGHVQSTGDASPLPYLKLLEIYRRRDEQSAYSRTRERFNRRFGATVPDWEDEPTPGHSIEEHGLVLERLQAVWPDPLKAMESLESLLFRRDPATPEFDLPVYSELLLLYSVARDLAERVVHEEVDLLLPLDESSDAAPTPPSLGFDLLFDPAELLAEKPHERSRPPLPDFHLDLLDIPAVPPSIAASNEPIVGTPPPDVDRPSGRSGG